MPVSTDHARPSFVPAEGGAASLLLGQVGRVLVAGAETGMAYAVMSLSGPAGRQIPLHFHNAEHEVFFCTRGRMQLWTGEESRILLPGDFASVPPGVLHAYQLHDPDSQFVGPISPGGWERFFAFCGTPYAGPAFPPEDRSPPPFAKFGAAEVEFGMKYRPDLAYATASEGDDRSLPGSPVAYYLRRGAGPRHMLFGQVARQLMTGAESGGTIGMTVISGPRGAAMPTHHHQRSAESMLVLRGRLIVTVEGTSFELIGGDCLSIPVGARHSYRLDAGVTEFLSMNGAGGSERLFAAGGTAWDFPAFPAGPPVPPDVAVLSARGPSVDTFA